MLLIAAGLMAAGDEDHGIPAQGLAQAGAIEGRGLVAREQQADRARMAFDDRVGGQRGGEADHGDLARRFRENALHGPRQADREIMLGGEGFGRGEHALVRIEEHRVGVGSAGVEAEK